MSENYKGSSEKLVNSQYLFNQLTSLSEKIESKIPTSLPADGGNADTVGGKLPSEFAEVIHNHNDLYYTETEINTMLNDKADTTHTHTKSEVGLGDVDNTADAVKSVYYATSAGSANVSNTTNQLWVSSTAPTSPFVGQLWIW